jgi:hypothetical protein
MDWNGEISVFRMFSHLHCMRIYERQMGQVRNLIHSEINDKTIYRQAMTFKY